MQPQPSILLNEITRNILGSADKIALLQAIDELVMPLFQIESAVLFVINEKDNYHYGMTVTHPEIDNNEVKHRLSAVSHNHRMDYQGTTIAYHFSQLKEKSAPIIFDFEKDLKKYPHPFSDIILAEGYKETLGALLQVSNQPLGIFYLTSKNKGELYKIDIQLFEQIADLIAIALSNILSREAILEREKEKTLLLTISEAIATVQNSKQLLRVIYEKIQPVFNYDSASLFVLTRDADSFYEITDSEILNGKVLHEITSKDLQDSFPTKDFTEDFWFFYKEPAITSIAQQANYVIDNTGKYQFEIGLTHDMQDMICGPLVCGGKKIGMLSFSVKQSNYYQQKHLNIFKSIADLIAVAVANILANEEILEREKEKTILLSISESISKARNFTELLTTIREKVKQLIPFYETGILIVEKDGQQHYDMTINYTEWVKSKGNKTLNEMGLFKMSHPDPYIDAVMQLLDEAKTPVIEHYPERLKVFYHPFFKSLEEEGYKEAMVALLQTGNKSYGTLWLNSLHKSHFKKEHFRVFQAIAEQVSVAVANILANEDIIEREKEKTLLLNISNAVSTIDNKVTLLKSIDDLLFPTFHHDDASFCVVDKEEKYFTDYYNLYAKQIPLAAEEQNNSGVIYKRIYKTNESSLLFEGSFVQHAMHNVPAIGKLTDIIPLSVHANLIKSDINKGLIYYACAPLSVGGKSFGLFMLDFKEQHKPSEKQLTLFAQIAEIIAIAFANMLANEEILDRETEKTRQLEILETLNQCNSWTEKFTAIAQKFDEFIGCDLFSYSIRLNNGKRIGKGFIKSPSSGLFKPNEIERYLKDLGISLTTYREMYAQSMDFYSGSKFYFGAALQEAKKQFELLRLSMDAYNSHSIMFTEKSFPKGSILFILTSKNENTYNAATLNFLTATAQQMTLSVMNILDNEEVTERERQKTLEIQVNNAVLANESFRDVMKDISESIGKTIGCDICYIRVMSEQLDPKPFHFFCERIDEKYTVRAVDDKVAETGTSANQAANNAAEFLTTIKAPTILSGLDLEALIPKYEYLQIFTAKMNIQSFILLPLQLKYNCTAYLVIGSKTPYAYIASDLELISNIKAQLSLTLDNRLAFYQIQHLKEMLETENLYLQEAINDNYNFNEIIGNSAVLKKVFSQASMVASTDTTVLIHGETGTGKELVARAIHNLSKRKNQIMVKVNCACLPAQLIESELFGHEKGAFTGAVGKRIGKFELANTGTIFLDEIGELPIELQAKLLRVIQEREFERIGGRTVLKTDIRIIAATNKDLELESREKRFRSDLYYRLNVFPIQLPSLKERKEDIPLLALHFAKKFGQKIRKNISAITNDALQEMLHYDWPGNIRELEHVVEHSVISSKSNKLSLARPLLSNKPALTKALSEFRIKTLNDNEKDHILAILKYCNGRVRGNGGAAQILDIHPNTLESRMHKLGIIKEHVKIS